MAEKFDEMAVIIRQEKIGTGIYSRLQSMRKQDSSYLSTATMEADYSRGRSVSVKSTKRRRRSVLFTAWQEREQESSLR